MIALFKHPTGQLYKSPEEGCAKKSCILQNVRGTKIVQRVRQSLYRTHVVVEYPGQTRGRNLRNRWMRLLRMIFPNASVRIIYTYTTVLGIGQPPPSAPHQQSELFKPKVMNRGAMNDDHPKYYPHQEKLPVSNSIDRCFPLSSQGTKPSPLRMNE